MINEVFVAPCDVCGEIAPIGRVNLKIRQSLIKRRMCLGCIKMVKWLKDGGVRCDVFPLEKTPGGDVKC